MAQVDSCTVDLPFDILPMIFKHLSTPDIRSCALANKEYYAAALPSLWSHVNVSIRYLPSLVSRGVLLALDT
ncbi:hypothetical protein BOTBODRAFT_589923 [Botryobasidium botryosum FD-172 SS1]|uniref:F-box domain-containing protein n=1 Tax=Botryobasidium botryosum (strain FD-172 SS1) TaxID=930990 RepID=A0A067LZY6_BOTB1|nr:hypothetical protein BOTBODRAFT_589923 [Botryobasidium botryosum FD-172 SS1]